MKILTPMLLLRQSFRTPQLRKLSVSLSSRAFGSNAGEVLPTIESATALSKEFWLDPNTGIYRNYLNGAFVESKAASFHPVFNPATNELIGKVPDTTDAEFEKTMEVAQAAFQDWRKVPIQQRQRVMLEYQRLIREHTNELAGLITLENGKTIADAKGDVFRGLEVVETACQAAPSLLGDSLAGISTSIDCVSYREPLGVCAGIGESMKFFFLSSFFLLSTDYQKGLPQLVFLSHGSTL